MPSPYTNYNNTLNMMIPAQIQQKMIRLIQHTTDTITYYLSINNIPQNKDKTRTTMIYESEHNNNISNDNQQSSSSIINKWIKPNTRNNGISQPKLNTTLTLFKNASFTVDCTIIKREST